LPAPSQVETAVKTVLPVGHDEPMQIVLARYF
jgi:hypothetical protein